MDNGPRLPVSDIERLQQAARKLLVQLEKSLDEPPPANVEDDKIQQANHQRLFGAKESLASTLVTLAELMLKLERAEAQPWMSENISMPTHMLSTSDIALVEAFVSRTRERAPTVQGGLF